MSITWQNAAEAVGASELDVHFLRLEQGDLPQIEGRQHLSVPLPHTGQLVVQVVPALRPDVDAVCVERRPAVAEKAAMVHHMPITVGTNAQRQ